MQPPIVELQAPDLRAFRGGNTGVEGVHVVDSGRPGPCVMVQALTHGNELCGAIALAWLYGQGLPVPPRGRLILSLGNLAAFDRFDPDQPYATRYIDEDMNRVWADDVLAGARDSQERRRARELLPFVDAADRLLDLHSMGGSSPPLMICGTVDKNADYARALGVPADLVVDTGHPSGLRMVERGGFGDPASPKRALLMECGPHWAPETAAVAIDTLVRFLALTGVVDAAWAAARTLVPRPAVQRVVRVTQAIVAQTTAFRFLVPPMGLAVVPLAGTPFAVDGDETHTTPHDDTVLVMPSAGVVRVGTTMVRLGRYDPV